MHAWGRLRSSAREKDRWDTRGLTANSDHTGGVGGLNGPRRGRSPVQTRRQNSFQRKTVVDRRIHEKRTTSYHDARRTTCSRVWPAGGDSKDARSTARMGAEVRLPKRRMAVRASGRSWTTRHEPQRARVNDLWSRTLRWGCSNHVTDGRILTHDFFIFHFFDCLLFLLFSQIFHLILLLFSVYSFLNFSSFLNFFVGE